ncbi:MAG: DUF4034 domain-containing protein [Desulfuromonadaceae bacterium]|nr:DUF4034 domain-containing protein [Desulfuromonadaceae bacterium]
MNYLIALTFMILFLFNCISCSQQGVKHATNPKVTSQIAKKATNNDAVIVRSALEKQIQSMFENKKYTELDAMADEFRTTKSRFLDGEWKLQTFYTAFDLGTNNPDSEFDKYFKLAEEWQKVRPSSITAQCVLAKVWLDYAWHARGGGYASEVKENTLQIVNERVDKAWKIVNKPLAPNVSECPNRLNLILRLARARGVDKNTFESFFQKAIRQEPGYYQHYEVKAVYLEPKWGGEEGDWQKFINKVLKQNPLGEGASIYTRTAWTLHRRQDWVTYDNSGISWDKMKEGFTEINRNYPGSMWNINFFAKFACLAKDKETLVELLKQVDSGVKYNNAWRDINMDDCRDFADGQTFPKSPEERIFRDILKKGERGDRRTFSFLGYRYLNGNGTQADPVAAYAWLAQDESENKKLLADVIKILSAAQLQQAKLKAEELRLKLSQLNR